MLPSSRRDKSPQQWYALPSSVGSFLCPAPGCVRRLAGRWLDVGLAVISAAPRPGLMEGGGRACFAARGGV
jgi:hypothetical protein